MLRKTSGNLLLYMMNLSGVLIEVIEEFLLADTFIISRQHSVSLLHVHVFGMIKIFVYAPGDSLKVYVFPEFLQLTGSVSDFHCQIVADGHGHSFFKGVFFHVLGGNIVCRQFFGSILIFVGRSHGNGIPVFRRPRNRIGLRYLIRPCGSKQGKTERKT